MTVVAAPREPTLRARRVGIDTHQEAVLYVRKDEPVARSEGFEAQARVRATVGARSILATLNCVVGSLLPPGEVGLSEAAWRDLHTAPGAPVTLAHASPVDSLRHVRAKILDRRLDAAALDQVVQDMAAGRYADVHVASFVTACAGKRLDLEETIHLTMAMVRAGDRLRWSRAPIVDKHCVGGLPGNRTTLIVVPIAAAAGLTMPKTSSRAITSPAGTADVMETLAPVTLGLDEMRRVVHAEGACVAWGGAVHLSPADDTIVRVSRALGVDGEGQLVASILSKKVAAGSTHVALDVPVGPTAKVRTREDADALVERLSGVAGAVGLATSIRLSDGSQPVGRGVGPALEARDVLAVLRREPGAPADLRERALDLAGDVIGLARPELAAGSGRRIAADLLASGRAWHKFRAICEAQGGMRTPPVAPHTQPVATERGGVVASIDNRALSRAAKLAGAPDAKAAGLVSHVRLGDRVRAGEALFTLHAETPGELAYALRHVAARPSIVEVAA